MSSAKSEGDLVRWEGNFIRGGLVLVDEGGVMSYNKFTD